MKTSTNEGAGQEKVSGTEKQFLSKRFLTPFLLVAPDRTARATSSFQNRYTYTGREWDPTLRLYYFRARWLEPKAGRFIGRDPLGYVDGMGLYGAYFAVRGVDPTGYTICKCRETKVTTYGLNPSVSYSIQNYFKYTPGKCYELNKDSSITCDNDPVKGSMTIDESDAAGICSGDPICEETIAELMNKVRNTEWDPRVQVLKPGNCCFRYLNGFKKQHYKDWNGHHKDLPGDCTLELLWLPIKQMHPRALNRLNEHGVFEYYFIVQWHFFRLTSYSEHGTVKVCCGKAGKRKCMYFDVGSKSYTGQYGGEDHWFSPKDNEFLDEMDLDSEAPWNGL